MRRIVIALAGLLILAGCNGAVDSPGKSAKVGLPDGITTQPVPPVDGNVLKKTDYTVLGTLSDRVDGKEVQYDGLTDDGLAYGAVVTGHSPTGAVLTNLSTGKVTYLAPAADGPGHIVGSMVTSRGWVVWLDQFPADDYGSPHWRLYSFERATRRLRMIAASTVDQTSATYFQLRPSIENGKVYLSAVRTGSGVPKTNDDAYVVPLNGSAPIKGLGWGSYFVQAGDGVLVSTRGSKLVREGLATGKSEVAHGCNTSGEDCVWAVGDGVLAFQPRSDDNDSTIQVIRADGRHQTIETSSLLPELDAVTKRWITFDDGDAEQAVYDLSRGQMLRMPHGWRSVGRGGGDDVMLWEHAGRSQATYEFVRLN